MALDSLPVDISSILAPGLVEINRLGARAPLIGHDNADDARTGSQSPPGGFRSTARGISACSTVLICCHRHGLRNRLSWLARGTRWTSRAVGPASGLATGRTTRTSSCRGQGSMLHLRRSAIPPGCTTARSRFLRTGSIARWCCILVASKASLLSGVTAISLAWVKTVGCHQSLISAALS